MQARSEVIRDALAQLQATKDADAAAAGGGEGASEKQGVPKFFVAVTRAEDDPFPPVEKLLGMGEQELAKLDMHMGGTGSDTSTSALTPLERERFKKLERPPLCVDMVSPTEKELSDEIQRVVNEFWAHWYNRPPMHGRA